VEDFTGLSKSTLGKLRKIHCYGFEKPKGNCPKVLSSADERYCVYKMIKSRVSSAVKMVKELERILKKKECRKGVQSLRKADLVRLRSQRNLYLVRRISARDFFNALLTRIGR
jgi:hypothetical protein